MRVWPLAIGLQERIANHHKRLWPKAWVVSVMEKVAGGIRYGLERRTTVNCRSSVESTQMTSKPGSDVAPRSVWPLPAYGPGGVRHRGSVSPIQAPALNCGNLRWRWQAKGTSLKGEADSSDASPRGGAARSSDETAVMAVERRGCVSYFPSPVKGVPIPKKSGGVRMLGVPTVADRMAQTAVKLLLEPQIDPMFHQNSYGYRPGRSAHDAIAMVRRRSWDYDWVVEFDIKGRFDNIDHDLLMRALGKHCQTSWILLYVQRWLTAPLQTEEGELMERTRGTPQGRVVSPLLAKLFLHYAFDVWVTRNLRSVRFCRYADDGVIHCKSLAQAKLVLRQIGERLGKCGLELHPGKTWIVYCQDVNRRATHPDVQFTFLGYTFRPRKARGQVSAGLRELCAGG